MQKETGRTGKVCKRGGTRESGFEEGVAGSPTQTANPAVPGRKRRSQGRSLDSALLTPAPIAGPVSSAPQLPPSSDMALSAAGTAVKVRSALPGLRVRPARYPLAAAHPGDCALGSCALPVLPYPARQWRDGRAALPAECQQTCPNLCGAPAPLAR
jgi:hypothetical protein